MNTLEVTIKLFSTNGKKLYKVTKKIPFFGVSKSKIFKTKKEAKTYFEKILNEKEYKH